jgi:hypothetical protein
MKRILLIVAAAVTVSGANAFAYDSRHDDRRIAYTSVRSNSLERHINHLNRMMEHVRWQIRHYNANWRIRRDVQSVSREVDRVNYRYRHGEYNSWRLRREIDRLHDRLHGIEQQLHVRSRDSYRWD